jgi:hypothetical protein
VNEWLFSLAVSLHNLEEAHGFPAYRQRFKPWQRVGIMPFRFALAVLTVMAFVTAYASHAGGPKSLGAYLHTGYMLAMLLNVFVPHLAVSLVQQRLMPGTVTAVLIILPVTLTSLVGSVQSGWLGPLPFVLYGVGVTAALLASLPLLFKLGARLFKETLKDRGETP